MADSQNVVKDSSFLRLRRAVTNCHLFLVRSCKLRTTGDFMWYICWHNNPLLSVVYDYGLQIKAGLQPAKCKAFFCRAKNVYLEN